MAALQNDPIRFGSLSMVTASLGPNDPELGARAQEGSREYVFVYNDADDSIIDVGFGCVLQSGASNYSVTVSSVSSKQACIGVVRHGSIATGKYGWVVTRGITPIEMNTASGTVAVGILVELAAGGDFSPVSNTTNQSANGSPPCGMALAEIVSSASGDAHMFCVG